MGAYLPAGAGEPLIRRALSEDPDGPDVAHYTQALEAALLERVDMADFEAIAGLAADASIAQSLEPGYGAGDLLAAIDTARAVGLDIHPAWRMVERDPEMSGFLLTSLISSWVRGGGLEGAAVPNPSPSFGHNARPATASMCLGLTAAPSIKTPRSLAAAAANAPLIKLARPQVTPTPRPP